MDLGHKNTARSSTNVDHPLFVELSPAYKLFHLLIPRTREGVVIGFYDLSITIKFEQIDSIMQLLISKSGCNLSRFIGFTDLVLLQREMSEELIEYTVMTQNRELTLAFLDSILKKLSDNATTYRELKRIIASKNGAGTTCILIKRTNDGRIQVKDKKIRPDLMMAQIFRWPNVQRGDLDGRCNYCSESKGYYLCVNPYHYSLKNTDTGNSKNQPNSSDESYRDDENRKRYYPYLRPWNLIPDKYKNHRIYNILFENYVKAINTLELSWARCTYFEFTKQHGDQFDADLEFDSVVVDNTCAFFDKRVFSLGMIINLNRHKKTEYSLKFVRGGVKLIKNSLESYSVICESMSPLFLQGQFTLLGDCVVKLESKTCIEVFNFRKMFDAILEEIIENPEVPISTLYTMNRRMCTVALSFNRGWGKGYKRQHVHESPCWMRIEFGVGFSFINFILDNLEKIAQR